MSRNTVFCALILSAAAGHAVAADGAPSPQEQAAAVQAIREYALKYSKILPNFTCTLTTQHVTKALGYFNVQSAVIVEQLGLLDGRELRRIVKVDGDQADSIRRPLSQGEFGNLLLNIFDPANGSDLKWSRAATVAGHKVDVLAYHVPQASGYVLTQTIGELRVPYEGFVYADRQTHEVLRIEAKCTVPDNAEFRFVELKLDYAPAKVAGRTYILPSHFVLEYVNKVADRQNNNDGRFSAYHEFSAASSIDFDGGK